MFALSNQIDAGGHEIPNIPVIMDSIELDGPYTLNGDVALILSCRGQGIVQEIVQG